MLKLEQELKERGITQQQLADRTKEVDASGRGVNRVKISRIIHGHEKAWPKYVRLIGQALEWEGNPDELFLEVI